MSIVLHSIIWPNSNLCKQQQLWWKCLIVWSIRIFTHNSVTSNDFHFHHNINCIEITNQTPTTFESTLPTPSSIILIIPVIAMHTIILHSMSPTPCRTVNTNTGRREDRINSCCLSIVFKINPIWSIDDGGQYSFTDGCVERSHILASDDEQYCYVVVVGYNSTLAVFCN